MIRIHSVTRSQIAWSIALFCLGLLGGMLFATFTLGGRLEQLTMANEQLTDRLADLEQKYERLLHQPASQLQVKDVVIELLDFKGDDRTALQLRQYVRSLLQEHAIGTPVTEIDHLLLQNLVHDRRVTLENREWRIRVVMSSITWETYFLYVNADATLSQ